MKRLLQLRHFSSSHRSLAEIEIFINGQSVKVEPGSALIQACEKVGVSIPRFCYHERLAVAGNCRMCLVEVEKVPKPVASCAFPVNPGMKVFTDTPMVHKAREGVMEFLLSNHPLDCPICDQGGECDLQDQSIRYGSDRGRFREFEGKRAVEDKNFGPLVKTEMTRCIQCTRCVRFANEVAGAEELGTSGRGNDMQIGMYVEKTLASEMSGNIIDLCPVGALTSKPYEFKSRPWELKKTESVDVLDAIGSNIRVDSRGVEVMRILPRTNEEINEEWINDKTRFAYDGLKRQRLATPLLRQGDSFVAATWQQALQTVADRLRSASGSEMTAVAGQLADLESMTALKDLFSRLGSANFRLDGRQLKRPAASGVDLRSNYLMNSKLTGVEQADVLLLIGTNPRHEGANLNVRIRKAYLHQGLDIGLIGAAVPLTYDYEHISVDASGLESLLNGKHAFAKRLAQAQRPMIIVGSAAVEHEDGQSILAALAKLSQKFPQLLAADWNGINVLQRNASQTGAMDLGFQPNHRSTPLAQSKLVYLLGADQISASDLPSGAFVVYQGHHGDAGAHYADVILPGSAYTEKSGTFVNTEGRTQLTRTAVAAPGSAREDWKIIRALSEVVGHTLPYDDLYAVRQRMASIAPHLTHYGAVEPTAFTRLGLDYAVAAAAPASGSKKSASLSWSKQPLPLAIKDFYMTDPISRSSVTMAKCSAAFTCGIINETEAISSN